MHSVIAILLVVLGLLKISSSYPADQRQYKEDDSLQLFYLNIPLEVEEPKNTIEDLPPNYTGPPKNKRTQLFPDNSHSCCPTVVEVIEPLGGKNRSGDLVELYQGERLRQRFYEVSCEPSIADQHCKYIDSKHLRSSKCVQQYSYTFAVVRDFGGSYENTLSGGWRLDYIQVRSGCSCQIAKHSSRS